MSKTIRGIDDEVFRQFKAKVKAQDRNIGDAVTEAMAEWLDRGENISLDNFESWDWGGGSEKLSEEFEEELYGNTT